MELEKILEEIENERTSYEAKHVKSYEKGLRFAAEAIRKHMADDWIPVEERLPENAKHKGTFCPKYQVDTKYGVTEGWYNPDVKSWYCLFWFMTKRYLQHEIDFKKGDAPEVVRVPLESDIVIAWRPLPEAYRPKVTKP